MSENINNDQLMLIGDVHGKVDKYWKLHQKFTGQSIQVGDFGFKKQHVWHIENMDPNKHKVNFGNHDDYGYVYHPHSLGDHSYNATRDLMTIRGAFSIDRWERTEGVDWWSNEELSYKQMQLAYDDFVGKKPKIVITHDCPESVIIPLFDPMHSQKNITTSGLQAMLESHQPELWVFGHRHKSKDMVINGTRFVCLAELETMII